MVVAEVVARADVDDAHRDGGLRDDFGYNQAHAEAAAQLKKLPGVKLVEEENVPETQAVQK
ncbi:MAG: hypothetical protein ACK5JG_17120, partial [Pseudomonadota bacterium]